MIKSYLIKYAVAVQVVAVGFVSVLEFVASKGLAVERDAFALALMELITYFFVLFHLWIHEMNLIVLIHNVKRRHHIWIVWHHYR